MSEILRVIRQRHTRSYFLILDCGHWYKWTSVLHRRGDVESPPPKALTEFRCPTCSAPTLVKVGE